jgi:hypothetical protein
MGGYARYAFRLKSELAKHKRHGVRITGTSRTRTALDLSYIRIDALIVIVNKNDEVISFGVYM